MKIFFDNKKSVKRIFKKSLKCQVKNIIALLTAGCLVIGLSACGANSGSDSAKNEIEENHIQDTKEVQASRDPGEKVEISFSMAAYSNEVEGWSSMIEEANRQLEADGLSIQIKINKVPCTGWPEYYQKVITQMAGGSAPDIGRIAESYMPMLIDKGQVVDLTDYVGNDFDLGIYYEKTFQNSAFADGRYYGLPSGLNYYLVYYNKDMFDAAGISYPSADWNKASSFEEYRNMAKALTGGEGAGKTYGFSAGPYMAAIGMFNKSLGGYNVFDEEGKPSMNDTVSKEVFAWFDGMLREDYSMPRPTDTKVMGAFDMFKAGRLGMILDGTWWLGSIKDITDFKVGIAAIPSGKGQEAYTSQFVDSFVIFKGSEHEEEAWEALKAIMSTESFRKLAETGVGGVPAARDVANAVIDESLGNNVDEAGKKCAEEGMNHTIKVPYNLYYQEADQKVNNVMDEWLLGKISPEQFADNVQQILLDYEAKAARDK